MKMFGVLIVIALVFSGFVLADDKDRSPAGEQKTLFELPSQKPEPPLKPSLVRPNRVEFEIENKTLKIYFDPATGRIYTTQASSAQIRDPANTIPDLAKKNAIRIAAAIFKEQQKKTRRRGAPRKLLSEREAAGIEIDRAYRDLSIPAPEGAARARLIELLLKSAKK